MTLVDTRPGIHASLGLRGIAAVPDIANMIAHLHYSASFYTHAARLHVGKQTKDHIQAKLD